MSLSPTKDTRLTDLAGKAKQSGSRRLVLVPLSDPGFRTVLVGHELACGRENQRGRAHWSVIRGAPGWGSNQHGAWFSYSLTSVPGSSPWLVPALECWNRSTEDLRAAFPRNHKCNKHANYEGDSKRLLRVVADHAVGSVGP